MKKLLLLGTICLTGASAFAMKDVTPSNYRFNNVSSFEYHDQVYGTSNIGAPVWETINGDQYFNNGLVVLCGGVAYWGAGNNAPRAIDETKGGPILKAGTSLVNLGGEVGQVLCINGFKSKINDRIKELYDVDLAIPACTDALGWFNINFFGDPTTLSKDGDPGTADISKRYYNVRCRIICNFFENNITDGNSLVNPFLVGNQGNIPDVTSNAIETASFIKLTADGEPADDEGEPSDDYYWDPDTWMVYEVDFCIGDDDETGTYSPVRMKYDVKADPLSTGTMFIRSVEFFNITKEESRNTGAPHTEMITLKADPTTGSVAAPAVDAVRPVVNVNGRSVNFSDNAQVYTATGAHVAAGRSADLNPGLYIANVNGQAVKFVVK